MSRRGISLVAEQRCPTGKAIYLTYEHALTGIKAFRRSRHAVNGPLHPYRCRTCRCWHVGASTKGKESEAKYFVRW